MANMFNIVEAVSLESPSREGLIHLLRHQELWPDDFTWNYCLPSHCALGLFERTWNVWSEGHYIDLLGKRYNQRSIAEVLGLPDEIALGIFFELFQDHEDVLPVHVADALEAA